MFRYFWLLYSTVSLGTCNLYFSFDLSWTSPFLPQFVIVIMILDTEKHIIKLHFSSVRLSLHHFWILSHEFIKYLDPKLTLIKSKFSLPDFPTFSKFINSLSILKFPLRDYNKEFNFSYFTVSDSIFLYFYRHRSRLLFSYIQELMFSTSPLFMINRTGLIDRNTFKSYFIASTYWWSSFVW